MRNCLRRWFLAKNGHFYQKRVQNGPKIFWKNFKFIYSLVNNIYCSYNKTWPYNINILEEIGQKPPKTPYCHNMQCIFYPKRAKTAKTRFFPKHSLGYFINRPKIYVEFGPEMGKFGPKWAKMGRARFFPNLSLGYFIDPKCSLNMQN